MLKRVWILILLFIFSGCSPMIQKSSSNLSRNGTYAIGTFWNYTQTPMAGLKASSIVESVLSQKNINTISLIDGVEEIEETQNQTKLIELQKQKAIEKNANYLITGSVQEWRYKTGVDAEPAVSFSIKIIDLKDNRVVFNGVGAKSGLSYKSVSEIAQEIANSLIPKFI